MIETFLFSFFLVLFLLAVSITALVITIEQEDNKDYNKKRRRE